MHLILKKTIALPFYLFHLFELFYQVVHQIFLNNNNFVDRYSKCSNRRIEERNPRSNKRKGGVLSGAAEKGQANQTPGDRCQAYKNQAPGGAA